MFFHWCDFCYVSHVVIFVCYSQAGVSEFFCQYPYVVIEVGELCICLSVFILTYVVFVCCFPHGCFLRSHLFFFAITAIFLYSLCFASGVMSSPVVLFIMSDDGLVLGFCTM